MVLHVLKAVGALAGKPAREWIFFWAPWAPSQRTQGAAGQSKTIAAALQSTTAAVLPFMSFHMHLQDPEGFVEDGGWSFPNLEGVASFTWCTSC